MVASDESPSHFDWRSFLLISLLAFLSGVAALSHELLWTRRLIDVLGATDWVTGRVLGFFFFGISLGGYLASLATSTRPNATQQLWKIESLIGLLALPAVYLPFWTDWIWRALGTTTLVSWQGALTKLTVTVLVVVPPAIAMGFTLPLFIRLATEKGARIASLGVWIYAVNTLGGVVGLWFTSTCLVGWLGAQNSMLTACSINLAIAFVVWRLNYSKIWAGKAMEDQSLEHVDEASKKTSPFESADTKERFSNFPSRQTLWLLAFVSGFVVLSTEVLLLRLIFLVVPSSYQTTSAVLANVILILAISSSLISFCNASGFRRVGSSPAMVVIGLFFAAIFISFCPSFLYETSDQLISIRYLQSLNGRVIDSIGHYWWLVFCLVAMSGGLSLLFAGLVFPAILSMSSEEDSSGKNIGILLAINGVGGLLGTEIFNSYLIGIFGIYQGFIFLACLVAVFVAWFLWNLSRGMSLLAFAVLATFVFVGFQQSKDLPYLSPRVKSGYKIFKQHFGRDGVWLIVDKADDSRGILVNNQYLLGGSGATVAQRRQLRLPWILKPDSKSVCCLGLATGITASGLEQIDHPPSITAVELSQNVVSLAGDYFVSENQEFFQRKNNRVVVEDARTFVAAAENEFDLIVGDLYRPHGTGEGRLYSKEHFQNVHRALTEDGMFCQWLPLHQLDQSNWRTIAATFQSVFPEVLVVYGEPSIRYPVLGLFGQKNGRPWDAKQLEERIANTPAELLTLDPELRLAREFFVGVLRKDRFDGHVINTLDNLQVEISAGAFWVLKDLRKNRKYEFANEFLSGVNLRAFNRELEQLVDPLFPESNFQALQDKFEAKIRGSKREKAGR
ncbi:MAG: hypothetical protein AAGA30_00850 [Planctomycetota bacterium]